MSCAPTSAPHRARAGARDIELIVFDVDGTLVEHSNGHVVWQVLNQRFAAGHAINAERLQAFVQGRLTYAQWVALDVQGWIDGGATRALIEQAIREELRLVPHARRVVSELRDRGYTVGVVSGTIDIVLEVLFPDHPFHRVFSNELLFDHAGAITGWRATPYDMEGKAEAIAMWSAELGIEPSRIAFVGDHLNDRAAMRLVGMPIAYDPKRDEIRALAKHVLARGELDKLLDLFP